LAAGSESHEPVRARRQQRQCSETESIQGAAAAKSTSDDRVEPAPKSISQAAPIPDLVEAAARLNVAKQLSRFLGGALGRHGVMPD